jgi:hypothetical protein
MKRVSGARGDRRRKRAAAAGAGVVALAAQLLVIIVLHAGVAAASPGSLDPNFGQGGALLTPDGQSTPDTEATGVAVLPNGDFAVSLGGTGSTSRFAVNFYGPSGNLLWSQSPIAQEGSANAVAALSNGNVVAVGYGGPAGSCSFQVPEVVEYSSGGTQLVSDTGTCPASGPTAGNSELDAVAVDGAGNIVAAGTAPTATPQALVEWINSTTLAVTATQTTSTLTGGNALAVLSNGDAVVGQGLGGAVITALKTTGVDNAFGVNGTKTVNSDAGIVGLAVSGGDLVAATNANVLDLSSTGSQVWQQPVAGSASSVIYQPLGGLVYVGGTAGSGNARQMFIEQFNATTGAPIGAFGSGGVMTTGFAGPSSAAGLAAQGDGKVLAAGGIPYQTQGNTQAAVVRVYGPSLSVLTPAIVETSVGGSISGNLTATIDEPLPGSVNAYFCLPPGSGTVNGGSGNCNTVQFPANVQAVNVPVSVSVTNPYAETSATLSAEGANGLAPSLTNGSATFIVRPVPSYPGYELVASDGGIFNYGGAPFWGSTGGQHLNAPVVGMASALFGDNGYYLVAADGGVFTFGPVPFYGSHGGQPLNKPIVGMAIDPATGGYWLVASDGGIFNYNAPFFGSHGGQPLNQPIVGMASTPDGGGYWLVAADGGIFNYGDAAFLGSHGGAPLNAPIVGMAANPMSQGYWLVASDGGIFNYGNAGFLGSEGGAHLNKPVVGMASSPDGGGYWLVAADGGIFTFGDATFQGSHGGAPLNQPVVGMSH